ncbi:ERF superfamily protein [compost metagenome]
MSKAQLYQKISQVMQDVDYLQKDDRVEFGNTKYRAISEEKVTSTVRESLIRNKLVILPIEQFHSREGNLSTVDVKYKIVDTETGEYEILVSSGTGADTQDKGVGKAMTYAYKYLLLRTFAIPTGEDPDKTSSAELDANQKQKEDQSKKPPTSLKSKWKLLKGGMDGFDDWVVQMLEKKHDYPAMERALIKKIEEMKAKEAEANA